MNWMVMSFWLLDIFNFPFMQMFDTQIPINTAAWFVIWTPMILATLLKIATETDKKDK